MIILKKKAFQEMYDDEVFVYDSKPMSFNEYLKMVREREGEVIGVMKPYTKNLQFSLYNNSKTINYTKVKLKGLLMNKLMKLDYA